MRKQTKKVLSIIMSAALAVTAGAGINLTKSSAADAKPSFTIKLQNNGNLWGWGNQPTGDKVSLEVSDYGTYTLSADAPTDAKDLSTAGGALWAEANLTELPTDYEIVAKTVKVGDKEYDWSKASAYVDSGSVRLGIANEWAEGDNVNPLKGQTVAVKKDDKITFTFEVKAKDGSGDTSTPGAIATPGAVTTPGAVETPAPTEEPAKAPTAADVVGTAQLDSQANGWCGNEDCTNVKADINGLGTYTVSSTWEEVQEDPQAYCALRIADLDKIAGYITFSNVTVWVDGNVVDIPVIYGGDGDCRIQLWNTWGIPDDGSSPAGCEVPANFPASFYEIKVQFTIGLRDTERDFKTEGHDSSLISMDTTQPSYEPANKPAEPTPADPTPAPTTKPSTTKNAVKSLKAAKKTVNVKKGKKANVTVKVTAANNKKKTTDKVTATSSNKKVAKVVKTSVKAGKIVVSVKGVKKGTAKITVKAAKKKAVVTVKVK